MTEPIVFISQFRILAGKRPEFESAFRNAIDLIDSAKPRTTVFAAFVDQSGSRLRIVHVFPDATAMAIHFDGSGERSQAVSDLMMLTGFEVYGSAPEAVIAQLRREAVASSVELDFFPGTVGGFIRAAS